MLRVPVVLDTDIGSDIDDAVALAYLLRQPRCELLGVTTVSGEPARRAMLADAVCQAAGRADVPVHVGAPTSLLVGSRQPDAPQAEALTGDWPQRSFDERPTAIDFLRDTIRSRPGEVTLLAIGPLTNIGLLFTLDPELPRLLKQIVIMGGRYFTKAEDGGVGEWNIVCDPHAAAIVFNAPAPRLVAAGLDVTTQCRMPADECRQRFEHAGGPLELVGAMAEVWFRHAGHITFHDPLAAALIFEPQLCELRSATARVDLVNSGTLGHTYTVHDSEPHAHELAFTVDAPAFFEHYFQTVMTANSDRTI